MTAISRRSQSRNRPFPKQAFSAGQVWPAGRNDNFNVKNCLFFNLLGRNCAYLIPHSGHDRVQAPSNTAVADKTAGNEGAGA
jgi:hypothetical protein